MNCVINLDRRNTELIFLSYINSLCTLTHLISLNLALWSLLIYIPLLWIQEERYTLQGINGTGRHQVKKESTHTHTYHCGVFIWTANDGGWSVCVWDARYGRGLVLNWRSWSISHISTLLVSFSQCACFSEGPLASYTDASLYWTSQTDQSTRLERNTHTQTHHTPNHRMDWKMHSLNRKPSLSFFMSFSLLGREKRHNCEKLWELSA